MYQILFGDRLPKAINPSPNNLNHLSGIRRHKIRLPLIDINNLIDPNWQIDGVVARRELPYM